MSRDKTFEPGQLPAGCCDRCGSKTHVAVDCAPSNISAHALTATKHLYGSLHQHAGCESCEFLGRAKIQAASRLGKPDPVSLDYDLWYCPRTDTVGQTVAARFSSEPQAFYIERYPLRTDKDYEPSIREAALRAVRRVKP